MSKTSQATRRSFMRCASMGAAPSGAHEQRRVDPRVAPTYEGAERSINRLCRRNLEGRCGDPPAVLGRL